MARGGLPEHGEDRPELAGSNASRAAQLFETA
jgi:hypothetical protein